MKSVVACPACGEGMAPVDALMVYAHCGQFVTDLDLIGRYGARSRWPDTLSVEGLTRPLAHWMTKQ